MMQDLNFSIMNWTFHPESLVVAEAKLDGKIIVDAGTVIQPKAMILAGNGEIRFGKNNIVEEGAIIENL